MVERGNGRQRYEVLLSEAMAETVRRIHRRAWQQGRGSTVTRAFRQIIDRLGSNPFRAGEPAYRLPGLHLQIRRTVVRPLVVDFAVAEDRPIVFIKGVKLLSTSR